MTELFPTKILLATDGSQEGALAATTAVGLARGTNSELHVVTVAEKYPPYETYRPLAVVVFHGLIREVEQVAVDGQKVGVASCQGPSKPDQVLIIWVGFHGASNHVLGRIPDYLGSMV